MDYEEYDKILHTDLSVDGLRDEIKQLLLKESETKCILGFDIYKYSLMEEDQQAVIPYLIYRILSKTYYTLEHYESVFFSFEDLEAIKETRIDTGDGFYVIIDDPLKAIIFLGIFCYVLELERARNRVLSKFLGELDVRFSLTRDSVYQFNGKYYGPGVIKCSRILSLDTLNRFLVDSSIIEWFYNNGYGIESLRLHNLEDLKKYNETFLYEGEDKISHTYITGKSLINTFITQKIGKLQSKSDVVDIYNVYIQVDTHTISTDPYGKPNFVISIGNLHTVGM